MALFKPYVQPLGWANSRVSDEAVKSEVRFCTDSLLSPAQQ